MFEIGIDIIALAAIVCLVEWRTGVYLIAAAGIMQDPFRKLVPGEPVYVQLMVVVLFVATLVGMYRRSENLKPGTLIESFPGLKNPLLLLVGYLALQHLVTIVTYHSIHFFAIGALTYFAPLFAVLLGSSFARSRADSTEMVSRYLLLYVALVAAAASGIIFDFAGFESDLLKPVGVGLSIFGPEGKTALFQGFFRAPEIAGWHSATALCIMLSLATVPGKKVRKGVAVILVPLLLAGVLLTGRRKNLMVIVIFIAFYVALQLLQRPGRRSYYPVALLLAGLGIGLFVGDFFDLTSPFERMSSYLSRGGTVLEASPERFSLIGIKSVSWALNGHGYYGVGAGALSQGSQYFGSPLSGSAEGGLGKITAELGLPGLVLFVWLFIVVVRGTRVLLLDVHDAAPGQRHLVVGLIAILAANIPNFIVASQAYGDPFIILSLGLFFGFAAGLGLPPPVVRKPPAKLKLLPLRGRERYHRV